MSKQAHLLVILAALMAGAAFAETMPKGLTAEKLLEAKDHRTGGQSGTAKPSGDKTPATSKPLAPGEHIVYDIAPECLDKVRNMP